MGTYTFFSGTNDGRVSSGSTTYSTARSGGTFNTSTTGVEHSIGQNFVTPDYSCIESFVSFDTSSIPDSDVVISVTLSMWLTADNSDTNFTLEARESNWGATVTSADFVAGASLSGLTLMASLSTSGIGGTGAYKDFVSDANFLTATGLKTGTVFLLLSSSRHRGNNTPTGAEFCNFSFADETGTTQDPKLTVVTQTAMPVFQQIPQRIWRGRRR